MGQRWSGLRPPRFNSESHGCQMSIEGCTIHMFCQSIRWILRPCNLVEREVLGPELILDPEIRHREVADLAQATPAADADRCSGICMDGNLKVKPQISRDGAEA